MSKITVAEKNGITTINNKLTYPENVNKLVYDSIVTGMHKSFVPVSVIQKGKDIRIECIVKDLIPLSHYFNGIVSKRLFLYVAHQLALIVKYCETNRLNPANLCLNTNVVFVDPRSNNIKCIFWPIVNNQHSFPAQMFFRQLAYELNLDPHENHDYMQTYKSFFNGVEPFSINNFIKMLIMLEKMGDNTQNKAHFPVMMQEEKVQERPPQNIAYDPFANIKPEQDDFQQPDTESAKGIYCGNCGKENRKDASFCSGCGSAIARRQCDENDGLTNNPTLENSCVENPTTDLHDVYINEKGLSPVLLQNKTNTAYSISKPCFKIGSAKSSNDLCIENNVFVSRNHAEILNKDQRYFIVDKNSKNKTFVDGKAIAPETEVEIFIGAQIRLANEEFVFTIKP